MTATSLIHEAERSFARRRRKNGLLQLGWFHFWLLISILAGMLALSVVVFFAVR